VVDWQAEWGTRSEGAGEGRQSGPHACSGREPGTIGGSETRHSRGVAQSEGRVEKARSTGPSETHLAQQPGATDQEDACPRTSIAFRGNRDRRRRQEADLELVHGCGAPTPTGEDPAWPTGALHGSTSVEHGPDCACVPWSVERGRTVPTVEEGRRSALGPLASVGGWVPASAYLCNSAWTDACEFGEDRAWNRRLRSRDNGRTSRDSSNISTYDDARAGASGDRDACAGTQHPTAPGCKGIRTGPLDAHTSFMYDNPARSYMIDATKDQIHLPLMRKSG